MDKLNQAEPLSDRLVALMRDAIVRGELSSGEALKEDQLAVQYGVSRIPIREALRVLSSQGFVDIIPYQGTFVVPLSAEELMDIIDLRIVLESASARLSIPNMTPDDLGYAEQCASEIAAAADPAITLDATRRFVEAIHAPARRPRLLEAIRNSFLASSRYYSLLVPARHAMNMAPTAELDFVAYCRKGDIEGAVNHIERMFRLFGVFTVDLLPPRKESGRGDGL